MSNIKELKAYANGRKLPETIFLGKADKIWIDYILKIYDQLPVTNDIALKQREEKNIIGTEVENYNELIKFYNQKYLDFKVELPECLKKIDGITHLRFGILKPNSVIPFHLDEPFSLRLLCMIRGKHIFKNQNVDTPMEQGDIYFINGCYKHSVENPFDSERVTLLGKFLFNGRNTEYLNELLRTRSI